jgi:peptidoglycan hydrolase-like protein with peptidoglycan-binding domain
MNPIVLLGLGVGAMFALAKSSKAASGSIVERVTAALATGNPATMRAVAAALRREGAAAQAADLERAAAQLEALPASSSTSGGVMKRGSSGPDVSAWQTFLRAQGYSAVVVDGAFGVLTEDGTKAFQRARGLAADGVVGPATLAASQKPPPAAAATAPKAPPPPIPPVTLPPVEILAPKDLRRGATGPAVLAWQTALRTLGYPAVVLDGVFGVSTEDATIAFQRARSLTPDGIVGAATLKAAATAVLVPVLAPPVQPAPAPVPVKPAAPAAPAAARLLVRGASGSDVLAWQAFLRTHGYPAVVLDGVYGVGTEDTTKAFQRSRGLTADGVVGPGTLAAAAVAVVAPVLAPAPAVKPAPAPAVKPPAAPLAAPSSTLKRGSSGADVLGWQAVLRAQGYTAVVLDGVFGVGTEDATKSFQRSRSLTPDGIVGPATRAAVLTAPVAIKLSLVPAPAPVAAAKPAPPAPAPAAAVTVTPGKWRIMKRGSTGADVREWQTVLVRTPGLTLGIAGADGVFGATTEAQTKKWQSLHRLVADGIVGPGTVAALRAAPGTVKVAGDPAAARFALDSPLPGLIPDAAPPLVDVSHDRSLAARLALHLHCSIPGGEDRGLVESFQRLLGLNPTGAYGPGTARALMRYGLVPAKPYYWPSQASQREKSNYRQALLREAARDPQRAPEWSAAASRV